MAKQTLLTALAEVLSEHDRHYESELRVPPHRRHTWRGCSPSRPDVREYARGDGMSEYTHYPHEEDGVGAADTQPWPDERAGHA